MFTSDAWTDPRTWISFGSLAVGFFGFFFGILSYHWNRRESRLDALSNVLTPLIRATQHLHEANNLRRTCEQLKRSFPDPSNSAEAITRVNGLIEKYDDLIEAAHEDFRDAEAEIASRSFRFPDRVSRLVMNARDSLSQFGCLVNDGYFDKADVQFAKFSDDYAQIAREGRGWRLASPFEGIRRTRREQPSDDIVAGEFDLTQEEMEGVMKLVHKRSTDQAHNSFAVHPPRKLIDNPAIATSDNVIDELKDSIFVVVFQDGTSRLMSLVELMVFTYQLIACVQHAREVEKLLQSADPESNHEVSVTFKFSVQDIMRPEMVKLLLSKIEFSKSPSDGDDQDVVAASSNQTGSLP